VLLSWLRLLLWTTSGVNVSPAALDVRRERRFPVSQPGTFGPDLHPIDGYGDGKEEEMDTLQIEHVSPQRVRPASREAIRSPGHHGRMPKKPCAS